MIISNVFPSRTFSSLPTRVRFTISCTLTAEITKLFAKVELIALFPKYIPTPWYGPLMKTLLSIKEIDEVYVYCSNPEIKQYIPEGVIYLSRSDSLDQDTTKMNEVLSAFASEVSADIYVMTHTTAPFVSSESIKKGLEAVKSGEYDSSFAAKKLQDFEYRLVGEEGPDHEK